jgi:hypothetical protein
LGKKTREERSMRDLNKHEQDLVAKINERGIKLQLAQAEKINHFVDYPWQPAVDAVRAMCCNGCVLIKYIYSEDWCLCVLKVDGERYFGMSRRNPCDKYDRRRGKDVALVHALKCGDTWLKDN